MYQQNSSRKTWVSLSNLQSKLKIMKIQKTKPKTNVANYFSNPLYDGLDNDEANNDQHTFGPWVQKLPEKRDNIVIEPLKKSAFKIAYDVSPQIRINDKNEKIENITGMRNRDSEHILPDLKFASLQLNSVKNISGKPTKHPKIKHSKSSLAVHIDRLPKTNNKPNSKPFKYGNFIYNYCYTQDEYRPTCNGWFKNRSYHNNQQLLQQLKLHQKERRLN